MPAQCQESRFYGDDEPKREKKTRKCKCPVDVSLAQILNLDAMFGI